VLACIAHGEAASSSAFACAHLQACVKDGDSLRADRIYAEMQQRTNHFSTFIPPSALTYKHMMQVHMRAGSPSRVLELFHEMLKRGISPKRAHYATALSAVSYHLQLPQSVPRMLRIYVAMRKDGIRLETRTLLELEKMCRYHGRGDIARRLRRERSML
jgi:pentatricopeptide repeat protein